MRSRPRIPFEPELLLPDVTKRMGKSPRFLSDAGRLAYERMRVLLKRYAERLRKEAA